MYSLLSGLVKYVLKKDEYCVLIIGLDNAGKTTFLEQVRVGRGGGGEYCVLIIGLDNAGKTTFLEQVRVGRGGGGASTVS